jgi:hypothetical protein
MVLSISSREEILIGNASLKTIQDTFVPTTWVLTPCSAAPTVASSRIEAHRRPKTSWGTVSELDPDLYEQCIHGTCRCVVARDTVTGYGAVCVCVCVCVCALRFVRWPLNPPRTDDLSGPSTALRGFGVFCWCKRQ